MSSVDISRLYTHNLNIKIVDLNDTPLDLPHILHEVKRRLHRKKYTHTLDIHGHPLDCSITWKWRELTTRSALFIGDFFASPIYRHDSIVYSHTRLTLQQIEREIKQCVSEFLSRDHWTIAFFVTKLIQNEHIPLSVP